MQACLASALAAACSSSAFAQGPGGVLVVRASEAERARAEAVAGRILEGALGDGRDLVAPPAPRSVLAADEDWLARIVLEAEDHYAHFALPDAQAVLDQALARLDREGPAGARTVDLVELFLLRARVAQAMGELERAREAARGALSVAPDLAVDDARHPPTLAALVEAERPAVAHCPVTLELGPEGALASVDGAAPAPAPASLPCGAHWLVISAPAHVTSALRFDASPDGAARRVTLTLDPGAALAARSEPFSPVSALAQAAALVLERELVLLDVAEDAGGLSIALGERRVRAPSGATPDEIVALLRAAGRVEGGPDVGLVVGLGAGVAVALALAITIAVVVSSPATPTSFELRGQFLP